MLQLVDQVMAVKNMRTSLSLTEERTAGGLVDIGGFKAVSKNTRLLTSLKLNLHTFSDTTVIEKT